MHPHHYALSDVLELLGNWLKGDTDKNDTYGLFKFLWLNRIGSFLQLVGGSSLIIDILGKERIQKTIDNIENAIRFSQIKRYIIRVFTLKTEGYKGNELLYADIFFWIILLRYFVLKVYGIDMADDRFTKAVTKYLEKYVHSFGDLMNVIAINYRNHPIFYSTLLVLIIGFIIPKSRKILHFPVSLVAMIISILFQLLIEFFINKPVIAYLHISKNDQYLRKFSLVVILFGFFMSFIFS